MAAREQLWTWLSTWLSDEQRIDCIESLDLQAFVRDSASFEIDAGERLRLHCLHDLGRFAEVLEVAKR